MDPLTKPEWRAGVNQVLSPMWRVGEGDPSGLTAPIGATWRQTDANATYGNLTGLLWTKVGTGTTLGTDWLVDFEGRWIDWTPTLTQTGTITKTLTSTKYTRVGKLITLNASMAITSSGTNNTVVEVTNLPTNQTNGHGSFRYFDSGVTNWVGVTVVSSATAIRFYNDGNGNALGQNPMQVTSGDSFSFTHTYEVA